MNFDLSNFYKTKTVNIGFDGKELFSVTVQEIPHGKMAELQASMFTGLQVDMTAGKKGIQRELSKALANGGFDPTAFSDKKSIAAIQSWTLTDANGEPVPVCLEAWSLLPHSITQQIEKEIEALNPDLDENFSD